MAFKFIVPEQSELTDPIEAEAKVWAEMTPEERKVVQSIQKIDERKMTYAFHRRAPNLFFVWSNKEKVSDHTKGYWDSHEVRISEGDHISVRPHNNNSWIDI